MVVPRPVGGVDYPRTWAEFVAWFPDDAACVAYLVRLRWGDGFVCPGCGSTRSWPASRGIGSRVCARCAKRTSVTAGTVFAGTRTPLTQWFAAAWHVCSTKNGASALGLQKLLGLGSYETAWAWLHKLRRAMVIPGRDLLTGDVEVDETFVGGDEPGLIGGRARGKKPWLRSPSSARQRLGSTRLARIPDAGRRSLHEFITTHIAPGSTLLTDGWHPYKTIDRLGYGHKPTTIRTSTENASELRPASTASPRCSNAGSTAPTKARSNPTSSTTTSTSSPSASTGVTHAARGLLFYRLLHQAVRTGPHPYAALVAGKPIRPAMPTTTRKRRHKM